MRKVVILTACIFTLLQGCDVAKKEQASNSSSSESSTCFNTVKYVSKNLVPMYCQDEMKYRLYSRNNYATKIPGDLFYFENSPTESVFVSQYDNSQKEESYLRIEVTEIERLCSPTTIGVSPHSLKSIRSNGATTIWGKVDFWDDPPTSNDMERDLPLCAPPAPIQRPEYFPCTDPEDFFTSDAIPCSVQMRQYEVEHGMYSAYALCSEKDGKRVVVCIQQMTDNPKLAEEIFSTFRWAK